MTPIRIWPAHQTASSLARSLVVIPWLMTGEFMEMDM